VNENDYETVELRLAETGTELWAVLEAAQYARIIQHEEPETTAEAQAISRFVEAFASLAESWQELPAAERGGALTGLSAQIEALQRLGLHVHCATSERDFAPRAQQPVRLPLAILTVSRSSLPTTRIALPTELEVAAEHPGSAH